jgi:hypothetical protein
MRSANLSPRAESRALEDRISELAKELANAELSVPPKRLLAHNRQRLREVEVLLASALRVLRAVAAEENPRAYPRASQSAAEVAHA